MALCAKRAWLVSLTLALFVGGCAHETPKPVQEEQPEQAAPPESVSRPAVSASVAKAIAARGDPGKRFADALALLKDHKFTDAQKAFTDLAADYPQYSGPLTDLGILYARNPASRDKAVATFAQALKAKPDNAVAQNWLGMLQRQAGQYQAAEQSYLSALKIAPNYGFAHLNLAILYDVYLKRPQDAVAQYQAYQHAGGQNDLRVAAWLKQIQRAKPNTVAGPGPAVEAKP